MEKRAPRLAHIGRLAALFTLTTALSACPSPPTGPDVDPDPPENQAPTASAGSDVTASTGIAVSIEGSGTDPDGDPLTYAWTLDAPTGSASTLDDATSAAPSFTPDVAGDYTATLVVSDGKAQSAPDGVTVTAEDNTTTATIGAGGGSLASQDGAFSFEVPPGALDADAQISLTPLARSQLAALGEALRERLMDDPAPVAAKIEMEDSGSTVTLLEPATVGWLTETDSEADTTMFSLPEAIYSDGDSAQPVADQSTEVDLDEGRVVHTASIDASGFLAFVRKQFELDVIGLPDVARVGETFPATLVGSWLGIGVGTAPEEAEVGSVPDGAVVRVTPATTPVRVDVVGDVFLADFEYTCDRVGTGHVYLTASTLRKRGDPADEGRFPARITRGVACTLAGGGDGFRLGLHEVPELSDIEAVSVVGPRLGSIDNTKGDAILLGGREGLQIRGVSDDRVLMNGIVTGSQNPITRGVTVSRPNPGPGTPAAILGSGIDFNNPLAPEGLWRFDYEPGTGTFADSPAPLPGAYWDMDTAGGPITDEIISATNFGVDFIQWNGTQWEHAPDERFELGRYGNEREVVIGSVVAAEAFAPLLVGVGSNFGNPGRLFFDDRGDGGPVDIGELGMSPAMIRCAVPVCVSVQARDGTIRGISWDGRTEPTIVGDPIPVGPDPGAVTVYRVTDDVTLAAAFTGWTDDDVTLVEFDDSGAMLSSKTMDLRAVGCRGPRNGDWMPNPQDPSDPYLVIGCYNSGAYYLALRSQF